MNLAIGLFVTIISGLALVTLWLLATSPKGWQDERGFHYGEPEDDRG